MTRIKNEIENRVHIRAVRVLFGEPTCMLHEETTKDIIGAAMMVLSDRDDP